MTLEALLESILPPPEYALLGGGRAESSLPTEGVSILERTRRLLGKQAGRTLQSLPPKLPWVFWYHGIGEAGIDSSWTKESSVTTNQRLDALGPLLILTEGSSDARVTVRNFTEQYFSRRHPSFAPYYAQISTQPMFSYQRRTAGVTIAGIEQKGFAFLNMQIYALWKKHDVNLGEDHPVAGLYHLVSRTRSVLMLMNAAVYLHAHPEPRCVGIVGSLHKRDFQKLEGIVGTPFDFHECTPVGAQEAYVPLA